MIDRKRSRLIGLATGVLSLLGAGAGCGGTEQFDNPDKTPVALVVIPAAATVTVEHGKVATRAFRAYAYYREVPKGLDGGDPPKSAPAGGEEVTDRVAWSVAAIDLGRFSGSTYRSEQQSGGQTVSVSRGGSTVVRATLDKVSGSAALTLVYKRSLSAGGAQAGDAGKFGGKTAPARAPKVLYPADGVLVPPNLGQMELQWSAGGDNDLFQLELQSDLYTLTVTTTKRSYNLSGALWQGLATTNKNGLFKVTVRGTRAAAAAEQGVSAPVYVRIAQTDIKGGLYYWVAADTGGIWKYDFEHPAAGARPFYTNADAKVCIGCHVLSRRGDTVGFARGKDDGALMDVKTKKARDFSYKATLQSFSGDDKQLVSVVGGVLTRRDAATGKALETLQTGPGKATHPDWSPDGSALAYAAVAAADFAMDTSVKNASLKLLEREADGTWKAPRTLLAGGGGTSWYYPTFSPDGSWLLVNRTSGDTYASPEANIYLIRPAGGTPLPLARINGSRLSNSWPRWSPFSGTYQGQKIYWITFSSVRDYGFKLVQPDNPPKMAPQIWMAAFNADRAEKGQDPSYPPIWLPFQNTKHHAHVAQWTERVVE